MKGNPLFVPTFEKSMHSHDLFGKSFAFPPPLLVRAFDSPFDRLWTKTWKIANGP